MSGEGGTAKASKTQVGHNGQVTLTATPNIYYDFVNWTVNGEEVSTKATYTVTVTSDIEFKANFIKNSYYPTGAENGKDLVDLGLSVKWATYNVGAITPEGYGDYFAWGETEPKDYYSWSTYKYCNGSSSTMTKYCTSSSYGIVDNKTTLELTDDAAHVNWGGNWRMPTDVEITELCTECTWTWITQNGVNGYKVTGSNGNSIFLPAAGYYNGSQLYDKGSEGRYWSGSLHTDSPSMAYSCKLYLSAWRKTVDYRHGGLPVRAVCK